MDNRFVQGQSFLDKVVELTGSVLNAFDMAVLNGNSLTDSFDIGREVIPTAITSPAIVALWSDNNRPATGLTDDQESIINPRGGIGYMSIGATFKVS